MKTVFYQIARYYLHIISLDLWRKHRADIRCVFLWRWISALMKCSFAHRWFADSAKTKCWLSAIGHSILIRFESTKTLLWTAIPQPERRAEQRRSIHLTNSPIRSEWISLRRRRQEKSIPLSLFFIICKEIVKMRHWSVYDLFIRDITLVWCTRLWPPVMASRCYYSLYAYRFVLKPAEP